MDVNKPSSKKTVVRLSGVTLNWSRDVLKDIDWEIRPGEHWVVMGRNGAGKTLLLQVLAGYIWPSRGRVSVLGKRFGTVDLRRLRQDLGWVSASLREKIPDRDPVLKVVLSGLYATFGLYETPPTEAVARAKELIASIGMSPLIDQPFGQLSQGQQQRTLLARGLIRRPALLLLDEPCAGLDLAASEKYLGLIHRLARTPNGPTLILVTHRASEIVAGFTHGLLLHQGRVLASGPLEAVLTGELLSQTLETPVRVSREAGRWNAAPIGPEGETSNAIAWG